MCVCACLHICPCTCLHLYMYMYMYIYMNLYRSCAKCVCTCMHVDMCVCMYVFMYACMYVCMHACMYVNHVTVCLYLLMCTHALPKLSIEQVAEMHVHTPGTVWVPPRSDQLFRAKSDARLAKSSLGSRNTMGRNFHTF